MTFRWHPADIKLFFIVNNKHLHLYLHLYLCLTGSTDECPRPFFFSCSTTCFKFFQTSVAFHRGMAVQHKAESRHAPSNQTAEALPGNRACSGTPTHWGLSSALTFSGSHLVSPWKKKRKKKKNPTSTHFQEKSRLLRCLLSNVSYQIETCFVFVFVFFAHPIPPFFFSSILSFFFLRIPPPSVSSHLPLSCCSTTAE